MNEKALLGAAKGAAYAIIWIAALITLFRGVVTTLWGSASDFGLLGAVLAAAVGIVILAWLAIIMFRDVRKSFQSEPDPKQ